MKSGIEWSGVMCGVGSGEWRRDFRVKSRVYSKEGSGEQRMECREWNGE